MRRAALIHALLLIAASVCAQVPTLMQAEYFWDVDPGAGNGIAMSASDGNFNAAMEQVLASAAPPSAGLHKLFVRVMGSDGVWSAAFSTVVDVLAMRQVRVTLAEYFWDSDPGAGNATAMLAFDGNFNSALEQVNVNATSPVAGLHALNVRVKGIDGTWGPTFRTIVDVLAARQVRVSMSEYFWDSDPGAGNGSAMLAFDGNFNSALEQASVNATSPAAGLHTLHVRVKGIDGAWGPTFRTIVDVLAARQVRVSMAEYFWNSDPGVGNATAMVAFDGNFNSALEQASVNATSPAAGLHTLHVRVKGIDGAWGPTFRTIVDVLAARQVRVSMAEYFWDSDPGAGNGTAMIAFDGNFNSALEELGTTASVAGLPTGPHMLNVRAKGIDGTWGPVFRTVVHVDPQPEVTVTFDLRVALQGCMGTSSLMNNGLRNAGLVPLTEPYSALGFELGESEGSTTTPSVLSVTFPPGSSVVDWVLVEFHPAVAPSQTTACIPLLVRRGGTVATTDGTYPFLLGLPAASYYVVVRHRNHLPVASATPVSITTNGATVAINFTTSAAAAFGTDAQVLGGSLYCMWSGNVNPDGLIKYTGLSNDRDPILVAVGSTTPNNSASGYRIEDVNMDGAVKYTGLNNDRDPILVNVGGTVPNQVRAEQLP